MELYSQPLAQELANPSKRKKNLEASLNELSSIEEMSQEGKKPPKQLTGVDLDDIGMINDKLIRKKVRLNDSYNPGNISILQKFKRSEQNIQNQSFD